MSWIAILIAPVVFGIVVLIMSVGAIFQNKCIHGSCGGAKVLDASGEPMNCSACPNRDKH